MYDRGERPTLRFDGSEVLTEAESANGREIKGSEKPDEVVSSVALDCGCGPGAYDDGGVASLPGGGEISKNSA